MAEKKEKKKKKFGVIKKIFLILFILTLLSAFFLGGVVYSIVKNAPAIDPEGIYALLSESSYLYDDKGELYERLQSSKYRTNIKFDAMPENLINAFIAIEDKTFWQHHGFNFIRLFGAVIESFQSNEGIRGTSTLTQQLARNLYLSDIKSERTISRKLVEAYYTVLLEKNLTKKEILEAYLNTIYLGFSANGVQAASHAYFGKDADQLSVAECALLATITKNPSRLAPIKRLYTSDVDPSDPNILYTGKTYTTLYNDNYRDRLELVLHEMYNDGYISYPQYETALAEDIREALNPESESESQFSSYFSDYVIAEVAEDIARKLKIDEKDAYTMLYNSGLKIYSTLDTRMQKIAEDTFQDPANFPNITALKKDAAGNILTADRSRIMLYRHENQVNSQGEFILQPDEYELSDSGRLVLFKDKKLNFTSIKVSGSNPDLNITIKDMYSQSDKIFYYYGDATIQIPSEEKSLDGSGNIVISEKFVISHKDLFKVGEKGELSIASSICDVNEKILQPQGALAIIDYTNGNIKALVGGRDSGGKKLIFNRATAPHPPGSSIKPLGVYLPALMNGWTAANTVEDSPLIYNGKVWPKNSYAGYKGTVTLRTAVEKSMNVPAVKVNLVITPQKSAELLKELGVTTVVENGQVNDINPAAMALGGMTFGISPLEMTAAYGTIANGGVYQTPVAYKKVLTKSGDLLLNSPEYSRIVTDSGTAFIMSDILRTAVDRGTGTHARIYPDNGTIPVAGKTGTTSNNYNLWFCGFTPYYACALWVGNDVNLELIGAGGTVSAKMWSVMMTKIHEGLPPKSFAVPDTVTRKGMEYFVIGTEPAYDYSHSAEKQQTTSPAITTDTAVDENVPEEDMPVLPNDIQIITPPPDQNQNQNQNQNLNQTPDPNQQEPPPIEEVLP